MATKKEELETGCLSRVPDDEPVFVLRAKDKLAPVIIRMWALLADVSEVNEAKVEEAHQLSFQMEKWQLSNGHKTPD